MRSDKITAMKRIYVVAVLLMLYSHYAYAQQPQRGVVMDALSHTPLAGVSIIDIQTKEAAVTRINGTFTLKVHDQGDTLLFTYTGYMPLKLTGESGSLPVLLHPSRTSLNELVVSASRQVQQRTEAPVAIDVISQEMIRKTKPVTLDQVLNKISGVYMVDLGNEQHTMAIRQPIGYRSNFLYLEDGIPIRTIGDFNHNALIEINQASTERIEVIKGPSSSLYGSDAVGGAVNFITKSPALVPDASVSVEGSSWGYRRMDVTASNTYNKTGLLVSGYYADQTGGYMQHNDFHKLALTARADRQISEQDQLSIIMTLINYYTDQNGGLDSAHFFGKDYRSFYTFNYRKVQAFRAALNWDHTWNPRRHSRLSLYYRNNTVSQNPAYRIKTTSDPRRGLGEINQDYFQSFGLLAQGNWRFSPWHTRLNVGTHAEISPAGYRARFIDVLRDGNGYFSDYAPTDSLLTDYRATLINAAAFAEVQTMPVQNLRLVAGIRYDLLEYRFNNLLTPSAYTGAPDDHNTFRQLTPKLGMTYDFGKDRGAYVNYSVGFAPPDISDLYTGVKVPYLKPARYINYELGGWFSFNDRKGYADVSLYRMKGFNEIVSVRRSDGSSFNGNTGETLHYGVEYTVKYSPVPRLQFRVSGTNAVHRFIRYVEAGKKYDGDDMNGAPHWIFNSGISYSPVFLKGLNASVEWQHLSSYYMDPENILQYKGYNLVNAQVSYDWKHFELWMNLINCGNTVYATSAEKTAYSIAYRPGPLRTLYTGIQFRITGKHKEN